MKCICNPDLEKECLPSFLVHSYTTWEEVLRGTATNTTQMWGHNLLSMASHGLGEATRGHLSPACLTVSPGLTETATTTPGIGERRMLLVSSVTFSSMNLLSSAASLVKMCTLYLKEKSIKEVKWRAYPLKQHFSRSGFVFKLQS